MLLKVTESVKKTKYYDSLSDKNVDHIDVNINNVDDEYIELYFKIQDDFVKVMNRYSDVEDENDIYVVLYLINEYFYFEDSLFPFEVAVYLIDRGYKKYFLRDEYFLALLYETPEIYDIVTENMSNIEINNIINGNIFVHREDLRNKYSKYLFTLEDVDNYRDIDIDGIRRNGLPYIINSYDTSMRMISNGLSRSKWIIIKKVLEIPGIVAYGEFVNTFLHWKKDSQRDLFHKHIDLCFYGDEHNVDKIVDKIYRMISVIYDNSPEINNTGYIDVMHSDEHIIISKTPQQILFRIYKKIYKDIGDVLSNVEIDYCACCMYVYGEEMKIGYTNRYKFSVENKINVLNPYKNSKIYNGGLVECINNKYSLFIPGAVHKFDNYLDISKRYPSDTLQELLFLIVNPIINPPADKDLEEDVYHEYKKIFQINSDTKNGIDNAKSLISMGYIPDYIKGNYNGESNYKEILDYYYQTYFYDKMLKDGANFSMENNIVFYDLSKLMEVLTMTKIADGWNIDNFKHINYLTLYDVPEKKDKFSESKIQISDNNDELESID